MFFRVKDIEHYQIRFSDGDRAEIKDFILDDFYWSIPYLIGKVDNRVFLISRHALGIPDETAQVIPAQVNRRSILESPQIDLTMPLSRDFQRQLHTYFNWPFDWEPGDIPTTLPGDLSAIPLIDLELERDQQELEQLERPQQEDLIPETGQEQRSQANEMEKDEISSIPRSRDLHTRSFIELLGYKIHATNDDKIAGKLVDIIGEDENWKIQYLVVDTGGLISRRNVLLAPQWVRQIIDDDSQIDVDLKEETIWESPGFNSIRDLTLDYQSRLKSHYGPRSR